MREVACVAMVLLARLMFSSTKSLMAARNTSFAWASGVNGSMLLILCFTDLGDE